MGQQQSSEKEEGKKSSSRGGTPQHDNQRKVDRRKSIQKLSHTKGPTAADPSLSSTNATAQTISQPHIQKAVLQHMQSTSPELSSKNSSIERGSPRNRDIPVRQNDLLEPHRQKQQEAPTPQPIPEPSPSVPMDVPFPSRTRTDEMEDAQHASYDRTYGPVTVHRPPRLPLPIADVAESPTLDPVSNLPAQDPDAALFDDDVGPLSAGEPVSAIRRQSSMLSNDTQDDDEIGDELQPYAAAVTSQMVPTYISWNHSGEKIYVTGTFANWERKFRLHKNKSNPGMSATIPLPPGTHHLKFIVDGEMMINRDLPTAVDYTNVLVNYLEVNADEIPVTRPSRRESDRARAYPAHPPLAPPPAATSDDGSVTDTEMGVHEGGDDELEEIPVGDFRQVFPQALVDMERPDEDPLYQQAAGIIQDSSGPPSLPLFLGKSILNGTLPLKDDSSVLPLPNHTVLNHLATSSLKNGVLATSVTTRYLKKYVTTIMYRPVRPNVA